MGLFDRFRNKNKKANEINRVEQKPSIQLMYNPERNDGIDSAEVTFWGMENVEDKNLMRVQIIYNKEDLESVPGETGLLGGIGRAAYIEPHYSENEYGETVEDTASYYSNLIQDGEYKNVKGFFRIEDVNRIAKQQGGTPYIGILTYENGRPTRSKDKAFEKKYIESIKREKARKENDIREMLQSQINTEHSGYQNYLDNEDARLAGKYNLNARDNNDWVK